MSALGKFDGSDLARIASVGAEPIRHGDLLCD
jgi:hypothetical protein